MRTALLHSKRGFTLIEVLIVVGILAILAGIVLVAINPQKQFEKANDTQRSSNVNAVLNAIGQYTIDQKGALPSAIPTGASNAALIANSGVDLCALLVPDYLPALPADPTKTSDQAITKNDCGNYDTGYTIYKENDRVTVSAPSTEGGTVISVTR
jgi:prepilin-type N-terminal cleavage/methylation domain-containing protein